MPRTKSADDVEAHRLILASFRKLAAQGPAVRIRRLAQRVRKDPRTVRHHLELMAVRHEIVFLNPEKSVVARVADLEKVVRSEKAKVEREELIYASSAGGAALAWASEG